MHIDIEFAKQHFENCSVFCTQNHIEINAMFPSNAKPCIPILMHP